MCNHTWGQSLVQHVNTPHHTAQQLSWQHTLLTWHRAEPLAAQLWQHSAGLSFHDQADARLSLGCRGCSTFGGTAGIPSKGLQGPASMLTQQVGKPIKSGQIEANLNKSQI